MFTAIQFSLVIFFLPVFSILALAGIICSLFSQTDLQRMGIQPIDSSIGQMNIEEQIRK
jgi:hypothetical protein